MKEKIKIPVVFCVNSFYRVALETVISSILITSNSDFEFIIFSRDYDKSSQESIRKIISKLNDHSIIKFYDLNNIVKINLESLIYKRKDYNYISVDAYYRFYIPTLLSEYKKVIYLDADIVVVDDLSLLYKEDISNYCIGAVKDIFVKSRLSNNKSLENFEEEISWNEYLTKKLCMRDTNYFNSGVLLINISKINEEALVSKLWDFTIENQPLHFQDQDALNAIFNKRVKFLDYRWNVFRSYKKYFESLNHIDQVEFSKNAINNSGIIHFVGFNKPWILHNDKYRNNIWYQYFQISKLKDSKLLKECINNAKRFNYKCFININIFKFSILNVYRNHYRYFVKFFGKTILTKKMKLKNFLG